MSSTEGFKTQEVPEKGRQEPREDSERAEGPLEQLIREQRNEITTAANSPHETLEKIITIGSSFLTEEKMTGLREKFKKLERNLTLSVYTLLVSFPYEIEKIFGMLNYFVFERPQEKGGPLELQDALTVIGANMRGQKAGAIKKPQSARFMRNSIGF